MAVLRIESRTDGSLQAAIWDRLLSLPAPFFRSYVVGDLAVRAMGIGEIRRLLSDIVITALITSVFSGFNFLLLFYYDWRLALVAGGLTITALVVTSLAGYLQVRYQRELKKFEGKISGIVLQFISGISKLRVAGAEAHAFAYWAKEFSAQKKLAFRARTVENYLVIFNAAFPIISSMALFGWIAFYSPQVLSTGSFLAFFAAFSQIQAASLYISTIVISILGIVPIYERVKPILTALPEVQAAKANPGELSGAIELNHVAFRYSPNGPLILKDVSLLIEPGEFVAFVGPSGSGKSTLFRLLLGFEKPESGSIYFDGQDLAMLDIQAVRRQIGVVLQNSQLMTGDIFTNIVGSAPLTIEDAWEAARMAGLEEDIRQMPMGMQTVISEGGSTFSGGQRQRLAIARAIVKKPRMMLFDEATSALDNRTQAQVSKSLESLQATRIVIAHRLSTIINADRIFVIKDGIVVQSGNYQELMSQEGPFAELAKRQIA
jgi:ATP-binding cassette subfamily C protein